jgi:hypothetical protein
MIHIRRSKPVIIMAEEPLYRVPEPHRPLQARDVKILGQEKMSVYYGCFVCSELGQEVRRYFFGFIVWSVGVVVVPDGPISKEMGEVPLEAKASTFRDVDTN